VPTCWGLKKAERGSIKSSPSSAILQRNGGPAGDTELPKVSREKKHGREAGSLLRSSGVVFPLVSERLEVSNAPPTPSPAQGAAEFYNLP
jgi:hypothetical protein